MLIQLEQISMTMMAARLDKFQEIRMMNIHLTTKTESLTVIFPPISDLTSAIAAPNLSGHYKETKLCCQDPEKVISLTSKMTQ